MTAASTAHAAPIFATDDASNQHLIAFDSTAPNSISSIPITGLVSNEKLIGIDFRVSSTIGPNSNRLYGVGSKGGIYIIDTPSGAASQVASFSSTLLNGTEFGVDFNPQLDLLRVVSDNDVNFTVNVDTGATTVQTSLSPGNPNITDIAYDRNDQVPSSLTTLFGIDTFSNQLVRIGGVDSSPSPAGGTVTPIGSLGGIDPTSIGGFDIFDGNNFGYLASRNAAGGGSMLSTVDLTTGQATVVGFIGNPEDGLVIKGLAIPGVGVPEPTTVGLLGLGGLALLGRRRRQA